MISKVDWISFAFRLDSPIEAGSTEMTDYVMQLLWSAFPIRDATALFDHKFAPARGRAPYSVCNRREDQFLSVYYGGKQAHVLVEISGGGCEQLQRASVLESVLELVIPVLSRLDIAVDMPTPTSPVDFVRAGYSDRFKSRSEMVSDTGSTSYVGSRDSERYARIYRYNPPHPRAEWLRCEFCLKHRNAQTVAGDYLALGIRETVARLGNSFQWRHPDWRPEFATDAVSSAWSPERRHGATVRWLMTSVFPAMRRLEADGTIEDLRTFLDMHLFRIPD